MQTMNVHLLNQGVTHSMTNGEPEIPPGVPPEVPPDEAPPGIPPGNPPEIPEPPAEIPPAPPQEVPPAPDESRNSGGIRDLTIRLSRVEQNGHRTAET